MDPQLLAKLRGIEGAEMFIVIGVVCLVLVPLLIFAALFVAREHGMVAGLVHIPCALFLSAIAGLMFVREPVFALFAACIACVWYVTLCVVFVVSAARARDKVVVWNH